MNAIVNIILAVQMLTALGMIGLILIQHGKGADMGAAFGSGSAGSLFGSAGSANFLSRATAICATIFFATCLGLVLISAPAGQKNDLGVMGTVQQEASQPAQADPNKIPE
jgi:preprotein translocase subunit SecG